MYKCIILPADGFRAEGSAWQGVTLLVFGVTSDLSIVGSTKSEQKKFKNVNTSIIIYTQYIVLHKRVKQYYGFAT